MFAECGELAFFKLLHSVDLIFVNLLTTLLLAEHVFQLRPGSKEEPNVLEKN